MVRSLLVTRFKMTYAKETRDMPVYHLVRARADVRAGPRLGPASKPCDRSPIGVNVPVPSPDALPRCGARFARSNLGQKIESWCHAGRARTAAVRAGPADRRQPDRARRRVRLRAGVHAGQQPGGRECAGRHRPRSLHRASGAAGSAPRIGARPGGRPRHSVRGTAGRELTLAGPPRAV
jgi:hypothetical protein